MSDTSKYDGYVRTVDAQQAEIQDRYNEQESDMTDEQRQLLELVELARQMSYRIVFSGELNQVSLPGTGWIPYERAIEVLRARLKPARPTDEVLMVRIKDYLRGGWDADKTLLTEMVDAWDAAENWEGEG